MRFALASHQKALKALADGKFEDEIVPVPGDDDRDEWRWQTVIEDDRVQSG